MISVLERLLWIGGMWSRNRKTRQDQGGDGSGEWEPDSRGTKEVKSIDLGDFVFEGKEKEKWGA